MVYVRRVSVCGPGPSPLERGVREGDNPVFGLESAAYETVL